MRISTTTLESFRLFMEPDQEWMTEDDLLATIRGVFVPTHKVRVGRAFGKILETPERYRVAGGYRCDGIALGDDVMGLALALIDRPHTVFEAKAVGRYGAHDVVAKADQLVGGHLIETKTTLSTFTFDKYAQSCQWRFMADIFQPAVVTYHVACLHDERSTGVISLRGIERFNLYPYAALRRDCEALVQQFADYVTAKGLDGLLNDRQRALSGGLVAA